MPKRRGAVIGYGFIAEHGHMPAYKDSELEIVALADVCAARRELAAKALPGVRIYEDHESLIAKERDIEFVDVTAPPYAHARIAEAALAAGLHVICEKPLATKAEDARALLALAEKQKRVLFPSHNYRHAPVIKAVRQVIDAGLIGKVHYVTLDTFRNTHARGVREWNENWRRQKKYSGGGIAMDHGSHTFYLAFEWLRSYPTAITAKMSHAAGADTEDSFSSTITFPTGTAVAQLTWTAGIRKVIYTVHGDKGAIRVEDDDVEVAIMGQPSNPIDSGRVTWEMKKERVSSDWMDASHVTWFGSLFERFNTAIEERDYVGKDARDALACIELITAAYASAADGCREQTLGGPGRD